jgi:hypothetical protein
MEDDVDTLIEKLILIGAMEVSGINEDGEFLYNFTPKLKEINPELFNLINESINMGIMALWEKGFLDIDFFADEPVVRLTDQCLDDEKKDLLDTDMRKFLDGIIERFRE